MHTLHKLMKFGVKSCKHNERRPFACHGKETRKSSAQVPCLRGVRESRCQCSRFCPHTQKQYHDAAYGQSGDDQLLTIKNLLHSPCLLCVRWGQQYSCSSSPVQQISADTFSARVAASCKSESRPTCEVCTCRWLRAKLRLSRDTGGILEQLGSLHVFDELKKIYSVMSFGRVNFMPPGASNIGYFSGCRWVSQTSLESAVDCRWMNSAICGQSSATPAQQLQMAYVVLQSWCSSQGHHLRPKVPVPAWVQLLQMGYSLYLDRYKFELNCLDWSARFGTLWFVPSQRLFPGPGIHCSVTTEKMARCCNRGAATCRCWWTRGCEILDLDGFHFEDHAADGCLPVWHWTKYTYTHISMYICTLYVYI